MAAISPELQKELLRAELEKEQRAASKLAIQAKEGKERELNDKENAALINYVNILLAGREAWLKQMREAKMLKKHRTLTLEEEDRLNNQVHQLLRDKPNFIANFKYESNEISDTDPNHATGFDAKLKGMFSKMSSAFGEDPFGFIGQLFEKILSFIFPMMAAFKEMGEVLNPKKTVADLIKESSFDLADVELESQEQALIDKLKTIKGRNGAEIREIKQLLENYERKLLEFNEVELKNDVKVPFSEATEEYKRHVLSLRMRMFNELSAKAAPILNAHTETVAAEQRHQLKRQQHTRLRETMAGAVPHSPEADILKARMKAMAADMKELEERRNAAAAQEIAFVGEAINRGGMNAGIVNMYANATHAEKLARERLRQEAIIRQREQALQDEQERRRARFAPQELAAAEEVD